MNSNPSNDLPTPTPPDDPGGVPSAPGVDGGIPAKKYTPAWIAVAYGADFKRIADAHPECYPSIAVTYLALLHESSKKQNRATRLVIPDQTLARQACVSLRTIQNVKPLLAELGLAAYRSNRVKGLRNPPTEWELFPSVIPFKDKGGVYAMHIPDAHTTDHSSLCALAHTPCDAHEETPSGGTKLPRRGSLKNKHISSTSLRGAGEPPHEWRNKRQGKKVEGKASGAAFEPIRTEGSAIEKGWENYR